MIQHIGFSPGGSTRSRTPDRSVGSTSAGSFLQAADAGEDAGVGDAMSGGASHAALAHITCKTDPATIPNVLHPQKGTGLRLTSHCCLPPPMLESFLNGPP